MHEFGAVHELAAGSWHIDANSDQLISHALRGSVHEFGAVHALAQTHCKKKSDQLISHSEDRCMNSEQSMSWQKRID